MHDKEIEERIASFSQWHYRFDLKGHHTPIFNEKHANRHLQRKRYFFDPLGDLLGGSMEGKRVLDLGCNAGFWSLWAVRSGAEYVLGIDGRRMHIDQANFVFEVEGVDRSKYDFVEGNIFELGFEDLGSFDIVLCLGLMYHISKHVDLMERINQVNTDLLVIDSTLSTVQGAFLELRHDYLDEPRDALDYELVMVPTVQAVHDLTRQFGYSTVTLKPEFDDYEGSNDYLKGARRAFLCAKRTDLSGLRVATEPLPVDERATRREARATRLEQIRARQGS